MAAGGSNQASPGLADLDFALARLTGGKSSFPGFAAEVYQLKDFTLKAAPDKFRVFWRSEGGPDGTVKFDVRSREARWDETKFGSWHSVATKTTERSKMLKATAGRTVCFRGPSPRWGIHDSLERTELHRDPRRRSNVG